MIEHPGGRIAHLLHQPADRTSIGLRAVCTFVEGGDAGAWQRRQRAVDYANDLTKEDLIGRAGETVTPSRATATRQHPVLPQFQQDGFEEFAGDAFLFGDSTDVERFVVRLCRRHHEQGTKRVFSLLGEHVLPTAARDNGHMRRYGSRYNPIGMEE
jgi:hypothetical protein